MLKVALPCLTWTAMNLNTLLETSYTLTYTVDQTTTYTHSSIQLVYTSFEHQPSGATMREGLKSERKQSGEILYERHNARPMTTSLTSAAMPITNASLC